MKIEQAMILAAGFGTRLRPLTDTTPKPLIMIGSEPIIVRNLKLLKNAGVKEACINIHHLGAKIKKELGDGKKFGIKIIYSNEKKILGTGGGIKRAQPFLKKGPFFVVNADVLIDIDLKKVAARHAAKKTSATMVLRKLRTGEKYAAISVSKDGCVTCFGEGKFMFTGVQILEPVIFEYLKKPSCLIKDGYKKMLSDGLCVTAFVHSGYWNDVGTFERLEAARRDIRKISKLE